MYLNEVTIAGNLTRDPELKALPSGMQVASFSVAVNRVWNDRDGKRQESVEYVNCVVFGKTAETIAKYFTKGKPIYVRGRLQTRSWEADGKKQYRTEVMVDRFQFMNDGKGGESSSKQTARHDDPASHSVLPDYPEEDINPEDIPF
jgi:single-strand DNA-binding protein